jgi:Flp pilus assembly protein TadB
MMARTTNTDRLEFLRLFKGCLEANLSIGNDIEDVIKELNKAIRRRERQEQPR